MSFRLKTILGIALIEITLLPILIIMSINYLKNSNEEQLRYRANTTAKLFSKSVQDAVLSYDLATLDSLVSHLLNDSAIVYIRIANNNQVLAQGGDKTILSQSRTPDISLDQVEDGVFDVVAPIEGSGFRYGTVSLGMSTSIIEQTIRKAGQYISLIALVQVILVMLLSLVFGTYLTRQLRRLEMASMKIRSSGPGHKIDVQGNDEIAATMRAFNDMSQSLLNSQNESDKSKEAYQQLALVAANNEAKTKATLEACLDGIITINCKGEIVEYNAQAELIFGWPREEMLGASLSRTIIPPEMREPHEQGFTHFLETGVGPVLNKRLELPALHQNGSQIVVEISIVPVEIDSQQMFTAFLHDITKQKEATEAIEQARTAADQSNRAKTRFLATMSHEIRSPLNAIINMNKLLLESSLDKQQKQFANIAHEGSLTLLALINDILSFSQIEAGEVKLNRNNVNPMAMIQAVAELHAGLALNQGLILQTIVHPSLNRTIVSDELRLRQIVTNLLSNAIKFTGEGCIIIRLEPDDKPAHFRLSVTDTGEGIPLDKQEDIFNEFKQLEDQDNRRFAGSGLGLAITRRLVKLFGGDIELESQPGKGSRFDVILPLEFADADVTSFQRLSYPGPIVVNLANPMLRSTIVELRNLWGLKAYDAKSLPELTDHSDQSAVMLVDLDAGYTELSDHQLTANSLSATAQWQFIAVTSAHATDNEHDLPQTGYVAILKTPISIKSLSKAICQNHQQNYDEKSHSVSSLNTEKIQCKVLLVDDSQSNLAVGEALLQLFGCEVMTAKNGDEAIKQSSKQRYDVIFMDLAMPIMDGLTATKIIRETTGPNQSTAIVALTANAFNEDRKRCLENGMDDYLSKPIVREQLFDIVKRYGKVIAEENTDETPATTATEQPLTDSEVLDRTVLEKLKKEISAKSLPAILGIYLDEVAKRIELIQQYHSTGDIAALGGEAHALKSSSASFGALSLAETARELELAARESNRKGVDLQMENLQSLAERSIAAINAYLADLNLDEDEK